MIPNMSDKYCSEDEDKFDPHTDTYIIPSDYRLYSASFRRVKSKNYIEWKVEVKEWQTGSIFYDQTRNTFLIWVNKLNRTYQ